jgi:hypothetical protein
MLAIADPASINVATGRIVNALLIIRLIFIGLLAPLIALTQLRVKGFGLRCQE